MNNSNEKYAKAIKTWKSMFCDIEGNYANGFELWLLPNYGV